MSSVFSNYLGNQVLTSFIANGAWVSLHSANPGTTGTGEISGGAYEREQGNWSTPASKTTANTNELRFLSLTPNTLGWYGIWDAQVGGNFLLGIAFDVSGGDATKAIADGDTYVVPVNEIAITL